MKGIRQTKLPGIGMRIVKSAVAVFICFIFYFFFRKNGIIFYSQLAALWCMQPYMNNTRAKAFQRTIGTLTGAGVGLIILLIDKNLIPSTKIGNLCYNFLVSIAIVLVIYFTILIHKRDASYFSCVVFLSIVVNHIGDANPYLFVFDRVMDTMIGLAIGMSVNAFRLPYRKEKNILFVSGMDDTLLTQNQSLSAYSLVELNRMISDGAHFTVSTMRTPASLIKPLQGVSLNLPVIAMDGAVLYDTQKNEYLQIYVISTDTAEQICRFLDGFHINYFINMILDNMLVIEYDKLENEAETDVYEKLHTSPYRNYTTQKLLCESQCVYFMILQKQEKTAEIYDTLQHTTLAEKLRMVTYPSEDYPGYAYIKIYNKNATRDNMLAYLQKKIGTEKTVTFGSIKGKYDVLVEDYDNNKVVKTLKRMYEPLIINPRIRKAKK